MIFVSAVGFIAGVPISAWLMKVLKKEKYVLALSAIVIAIAQFSEWSLPPFGCGDELSRGLVRDRCALYAAHR
ncbi:hypothetical protein D3C73_1595080 [compost metagenome]